MRYSLPVQAFFPAFDEHQPFMLEYIAEIFVVFGDFQRRTFAAKDLRGFLSFC